jgi:hypothetical protein
MRDPAKPHRAARVPPGGEGGKLMRSHSRHGLSQPRQPARAAGNRAAENHVRRRHAGVVIAARVARARAVQQPACGVGDPA